MRKVESTVVLKELMTVDLMVVHSVAPLVVPTVPLRVEK